MTHENRFYKKFIELGGDCQFFNDGRIEECYSCFLWDKCSEKDLTVDELLKIAKERLNESNT